MPLKASKYRHNTPQRPHLWYTAQTFFYWLCGDIMLDRIIAFCGTVWAIALEAGEVLCRPTVLLMLTGVALGISSFVRFVSPDVGRLRWAAATLLLATALILGDLNPSPGPSDIDAVPLDRQPVPHLNKPAVERLRSAWDSEDRQAKWPVCETLATLSEIAYLSPSEADEAAAQLGFSGLTPVVHNSMLGYVVWHDDIAVIVFRGTNEGEVTDWAVNLRDTTFDTSEGGCHRGFWLAYQSLKPQVLRVLGKKRPKYLWITGHSLGGAMALVCAVDLALNHDIGFDGLITFGQPKVADNALARYIDTALVGRYARIVNRDDLVARIPPGKAFCGSLVWFSPNGLRRSRPLRQGVLASQADEAAGDDWSELTPLTEEQFIAWQKANSGNKKMREALPDEPPTYQGNWPPIRDHGIGEYIDRIREHLSKY
jgi:triacylglycerol lipase